MWVWGEIGYAPITSGRQRATVSATARQPSIWLGMGGDEIVSGERGGNVPVGDRTGEAFADRRLQGHRRT